MFILRYFQAAELKQISPDGQKIFPFYRTLSPIRAAAQKVIEWTQRLQLLAGCWPCYHCPETLLCLPERLHTPMAFPVIQKRKQKHTNSQWARSRQHCNRNGRRGRKYILETRYRHSIASVFSDVHYTLFVL